MKIAASILSADLVNLQNDIKKLDDLSVDWLHCDIMDGNFVPNITFGSDTIAAIRPLTNKVLDVHLMVKHPQDWIVPFVKAGANLIYVHYEAITHHSKLLSFIKSQGVKVGLAINPATCEDVLRYLIDSLDAILVMSVDPGFGGQTFLEPQLDKIRAIKKNYVKDRDIDIVVDGGVSLENASYIKEAGASVLVAGTALFSSENWLYNIDILRNSSIIA